MTAETEHAAERQHELEHLRANSRWFLLLGILLVACGIVAIVFPVITSVAAISVLGVVLLIAGIATIVGSFWAGKWRGFLIQLLVGILYIACGFVVTDRPVVTTVMITLFLAVFFMVLGVFRTVGALILRFPQWGWALLNGVVTLVAGLVIYRLWPIDALWVIGLLVGVELLCNGWMWICLAREIRSLPQILGGSE